MAKQPFHLADFEILRRLGAGGMAEVFLAKKRGAEGTFKLLVVKRILPAQSTSRRFRAMFVDEAHLATRLNHPNIVQVYEFSDHGEDGLLLSMEYVEGFDLGKLMSAAKQKSGKIPPYVSAFIIAESAKGLHYAHERKDEGGASLSIVHRDVSPQNILLSCDGIVKIADFGIAAASLFRDEPGVLKGKFNYMSPEQARGEKADRRSDIYALGVTFYEMLTLRSPYGKLPDEKLLEAVRTGGFEPPSNHVHDVPPELEAIVLRAMSKTASDRYQTARDMAGAIARVLITKQELIDNTSVEAAILHLLGRAPMTQQSLPPSAAPSQPQTLAAVRHPRGSAPSSSDSGGGGVSSLRGSSRGAYSGSDPSSPSSRSNPRVVREVRHVAVVTLRIQGIDELEMVQGRNAARRTCDSIRATLDDIAYKRGAVWSWGSNNSACALVGLLANPSRAAADAASLAIDTHESLAGASEDLPVALRAALGIVRGVASGERDEQGNLVNHELQGGVMHLAGQLGSRTPFGKTWVGGGVYRLVRRDFRWSDAPSLDIENAAELHVPPQMRLYALHRPLTREERIAEIAVSANDLVGRDAEKADLQAAFHRAVTPPPTAAGGAPPARPSRASTVPPGADVREPMPPPPRMTTAPPNADGEKARGEVVTRAIVGEMGIGKTALVGAFLAELPPGTRALRVECSPVTSELPYATISDLLREITAMGLDHSIEEASTVLRALLGSAARTAQGPRVVARLAELVTGKTAKSVDDDAQSYRRDLIVLGMRALNAGISRSQSVVISIDGLQWADRMSLELLQELLGHADTLPILVLLITRPDDRVLPFIERFVRIEVKGLTAEEQVRLVEARLGVRAGVEPVCAEIVPRVAGNPFFLLEMLDALLERGTLEITETPDGQHELVRHERTGDRADTLPSTLEQLIGDRIRELPEAEHDIVAWLAVAGGPLEMDDLLALARLDSDEAVTRLCARGLCDRRTVFCDFRHPLARDVAYLALDPQSRAKRHRMLGEHLAGTPLGHGLSAAIVARHLARGDAPEKAADFYLEAARAARNAHQLNLAQRYYQRVLARLPPGDRRLVDVHEALEASFRLLGRRRERRVHLIALRQLAKQSRNARDAALALVRTARLELDEGYLARGLPMAQRAAEIAHLAKHPSLEVEAQTILSEILRELGDVQGAISACERALRVAQAGNLAAKARAEVLRSKGALLRRVGRVHESVEAQVEAIAVFKAVGARRSEARAKSALAFAMFALERFEDAIALGHDSLAIDLAIGGRFQVAKTLSNIGQAYARLGDTERGLAYMLRAREAHERYGDQDSRADTLLGSAWILLEAGDVDAASTFCGDAGALVAVTGSGYDTVHERIIRALIERARGEPNAAARLAAEARQLAETQGLISYHVYATAIEAASRVDSGEHHTGALLARTALGAIEATQGSEYGVEVRVLSSEALRTGSPSSARDAILRAASHAREVGGSVRDEHLRVLFFRRDIVHRILLEANSYAAME